MATAEQTRKTLLVVEDNDVAREGLKVDPVPLAEKEPRQPAR